MARPSKIVFIIVNITVSIWMGLAMYLLIQGEGDRCFADSHPINCTQDFTITKGVISISFASGLWANYFYGVFHSNLYSLYAAMFSSLLIVVYSIWRILQPYPNDASDWLPLAVSITFQLIVFAFAYPLYQEYKWRLYRKIGADSSIKHIWKSIMIFRASLVLDLMFVVIASLCAGKGIFDDPTRLALNIANLLMGFVFCIIGWIAIKRENKPLAGIFFALSWMFPGFLVYYFIYISSNGWLITNSYELRALAIIFFVIGGIALLLRLLVLMLGIHVRFHFGLLKREAKPVDPDCPSDEDYDDIEIDIEGSSEESSIASVIHNTYAQKGGVGDDYVKM